MNNSKDIIWADLLKVQSKIKHSEKDATNPYFKSKYSTLLSVWEACKEALQEHGFSILQYGRHKDGVSLLVTRLQHISGEFIEGEFPVITAKSNDPQAQGSALTYIRRYSLAAMVGVCPQDDDAESATSHTEPELVKTESGEEIFVPKEVKEESFTSKAGRNMQRFIILSPNGTAYTSVISKTGQQARRAKAEGKEVHVTYKKDNFGYSVINLQVVEETELSEANQF